MAMTLAETTEDDKSIFNQKTAWISSVKRSKINLSKTNNTTSASDSSPSHSLSSLHRWKAAPIFTWALPLAWSEPFFLLFCFSDIFLFFIGHLSLSIVDLLISVLCIQIENSLLSISTRHGHKLLIGYKCVLWLGQTLRSKAVFLVYV